ncbi:MAG: hypothetical protein AABZ60_03795 [Planctomycetota bacterium]
MNQPNSDRITHSREDLHTFFGTKDTSNPNQKKVTDRLQKKTIRRTVEELTQTTSSNKSGWLQNMMSDLLTQAHEKRGIVEPEGKNIMQMKLLDLNTAETEKMNQKRLAKITRGGAHEGTVVVKKLDRDKETGKINRIRRGIYIGGEDSTGGSIPFSFIYPFLVDAYQLTLQGQGYAVESLLQDAEFSQILDLLGDLTGEITSDVFRHNKVKGGLLEFDGIPGIQFKVRTVSNDFNGQYETPLKLVAEYYRDMVAETTPAKLKEFEKELKHFENAYESMLERKTTPIAKINVAQARLQEEKILFEQKKKELKKDDFEAKARFITDIKMNQTLEEETLQKVNAFNKCLNQMFRDGLMSSVPGSKYEEMVDQQIKAFNKISQEVAAMSGPQKLLTLSVLYARYKNAKTSGSGGLGTFMMKALISQYGQFVTFLREGNQVTINVDIEQLLQNWTTRATQSIDKIIPELRENSIQSLIPLLEKFPEQNYALIKLLLEHLVRHESELLGKFQNALVNVPAWKIQEIKDIVTLITKKEGSEKPPEEVLNLKDFQDYLQPIPQEVLAPLLAPEEENTSLEDIPEAPLSPIANEPSAPPQEVELIPLSELTAEDIISISPIGKSISSLSEPSTAEENSTEAPNSSKKEN